MPKDTFPGIGDCHGERAESLEKEQETLGQKRVEIKEGQRCGLQNSGVRTLVRMAKCEGTWPWRSLIGRANLGTPWGQWREVKNRHHRVYCQERRMIWAKEFWLAIRGPSWDNQKAEWRILQYWMQGISRDGPRRFVKGTKRKWLYLRDIGKRNVAETTQRWLNAGKSLFHADTP